MRSELLYYKCNYKFMTIQKDSCDFDEWNTFDFGFDFDFQVGWFAGMYKICRDVLDTTPTTTK